MQRDKKLQNNSKNISYKLVDYYENLKKNLIDVLFEAYLDFPEYGEPSYKSAKRYINWLRNHSTLFKIILIDNTPVGFVAADANWKDTYGKNVGEIHELAVKKDYWGYGIGKILLEEALKHLKEKEKNTIGLWVGKKNKKAIEFYKKYGFQVVDSYRDWLRMEKKE
ncbi:GNAT family N-acetyltransferase [Persephonella sp.]